MARELSSIFIRSCIEEAWEATKDGDEPTFLATLKALRSGQYSSTTSGYLVTANSQNGGSTSFHIPVSPQDRNRITPATLQEMWQEAVEIYRFIVANNIPEDSKDVGAGGFIDALLGEFSTIRDSREDFTLLNVPTYGTTL